MGKEIRNNLQGKRKTQEILGSELHGKGRPAPHTRSRGGTGQRAE